jgi:sialic acid synthase SpsE
MAYHGSSPDEIAICKKAKEMGVEFLSAANGSMKVDFLGDEQVWSTKIVSKEFPHSHILLTNL